ncbi:MAG: PBP1A family penicillin-binding protein, partial [Pseudomonadota bacterium]
MVTQSSGSGSKKRRSGKSPSRRGASTPARSTKKSSSSPAKKRKSKTASAPGRKRAGKQTSPRRVRKVSRRRSQNWYHVTIPPWLDRAVKFSARVASLLFITMASVIVGLIWYGQDLPSVENLADARKAPRITVLDRYGEVIGIHGQDHGEPIHISQLPEHVTGAFLATEDRNFYHHVGINPVAILRALTVNMREGEVAQGGSTITQQLVKNLLLSPEQTLDRKLQEMMLALKIEAHYHKDEILSLYLNAVYFGNGAYGLEAAARRYFNKPPASLTIGEAAMLAGLLKAPSRLAPTRSEDAAITRASVVLNAMVEAGYLSAKDAQKIAANGVAQVYTKDQYHAYAVDHAVAEAQIKLGGFTKDITIWTTIDTPALKQAALARDSIEAQDPLYTDKVETAFLALEEDGAIRILVGGNNYSKSVYNRATQAKRQPGSVFKPFVYLAALEQGWYPDDIIDDSPIMVGKYRPTNYKNRYYGEVPLTEAMSRSLNAAVIRLQERVGRHHVVDVARRAGFEGIDDVGASLALGVVETTPLTVAKSFLPLSNGGYPYTPYIIRQIEDTRGEILYTYAPPLLKTAIFDPQTLIAFDHMMRTVVHSGSGVRARIPGHHAAGKTGTSQDSRDAWFAGYVSGIVGVVWLGKDDNSPMEEGRGYISGSRTPATL